ncbi:hypothetical protein M9H77_27213 [Catharanthus roseus]|uniref:Uncharacterized protein n=1 Tax=Catharanthus roseus TaxID=4058 RepID=A0ACC0AC26_CATRO|nr:hypothetical protein M9H77_27213 [Catharanthus roseus]
MSVPKFETDKFDGKSGFVMWRRKMKAVLVQNKIAPAICSPEEYPESWKGESPSEKLGDAHSCLTIHLIDNVLREIDEKDNAFEIWTKLEKLYLGKSLSNKIYLKEQLFDFKMSGDDLSLSDVKNALKSKDLDLQKENKSHGENLFVRGRVDRREPPSHHFKSKGRSKSREKNKVKCF